VFVGGDVGADLYRSIQGDGVAVADSEVGGDGDDVMGHEAAGHRFVDE